MTWRIFSEVLCVGLPLGKNELVSAHTAQYLICSAFLNQLCHYLQALMPSWASLKAPIKTGKVAPKLSMPIRPFFLLRAASSWNIQFSQISCTFLSRKIHTKKQPRLPKTVVFYLQPNRKGILRDLSHNNTSIIKNCLLPWDKKIWQLFQSNCIINEHISEL